MTRSQFMQQIQDWFQEPIGQQVLTSERLILEQLLPGFFGYHLCQMSVQSKPLFESSVIQHKFSLQQSKSSAARQIRDDFTGEASEQSRVFMAEPESLPFEEDSLDVILLHHLLEYHRSPQHVLREVSRVARPMGQLIILGFNPISLWGLCKPLGAMRDKAPWQGKYIAPNQLMDWLNLLNFKIDRAQYALYGLPTLRSSRNLPDYSNGLSRNANLPFGAIYVIVARKQVGSMIPMKPIWQNAKSFHGLSVVRSVRPAARRKATTRDLTPGE